MIWLTLRGDTSKCYDGSSEGLLAICVDWCCEVASSDDAADLARYHQQMIWLVLRGVDCKCCHTGVVRWHHQMMRLVLWDINYGKYIDIDISIYPRMVLGYPISFPRTVECLMPFGSSDILYSLGISNARCLKVFRCRVVLGDVKCPHVFKGLHMTHIGDVRGPPL